MRSASRSRRGTWLAFVLALALPAGHAHAQQSDQPMAPGVAQLSGSIPLGVVFPVLNPDGTIGYSVVTGATDPEGNYLDPEAVDDNGDALYDAGFPAGSIYQFTSLGTTTSTPQTTADVETAPESTPEAMAITGTITRPNGGSSPYFVATPNPNGVGWLNYTFNSNNTITFSWTYLANPPSNWTTITWCVSNTGEVLWTTSSSYFMSVVPMSSPLNALQPVK